MEPVCHEILGAPECRVFTVDYDQRQARSGRLRPLHERGVGHPKPKSIDIQRAIRWKANREDADLGDAGNVLEGATVELMPRPSRGQGRVPAREHSFLRMKRDTSAAEQIAALNLRLSRATSEFVAYEVAPTTLSGPKPSRRNQDPCNDL